MSIAYSIQVNVQVFDNIIYNIATYFCSARKSFLTKYEDLFENWSVLNDHPSHDFNVDSENYE